MKNKISIKQPSLLVVISDGSSHKNPIIPSDFQERVMMIFTVPSSQYQHAAAIKRLVDYQVFFPKGTANETISFYERQLNLERVIAPIKLPGKLPRKKKKRELRGRKKPKFYSPPKPKNSHE